MDVAVERLREHNSTTLVSGEQVAIDSPASLRALAIQFDVLLLTTDRPSKINSWATQACQETGTALVHVGYSDADPCWLAPTRDYPSPRQRIRNGISTPCHASPPRTPSTGTGTFQPQAANAVAVGVAGNLAAHVTMSMITDAAALPTNGQCGINLITMEVQGAVPEIRQRS